VRSLKTVLAIGAVLLAACDGGGGYNPTLPPAPTPTPTYVVAGTYVIYLGNEESDYPTEVQVLLDSAVIYTGPLLRSFYYSYYPDDPPFVSGRLGSLSTGRHTLSLRILETAHGRETFSLSGRLELTLEINGWTVDSQGASWEESVRLGAGEAWTGEFEIRDWPSRP
jgi:hypothetical protein